MDTTQTTAVVGGAGYAVAAVASYLAVSHRLRRAQPVVWAGIVVGLGTAVAAMGASLQELGFVETLNHRFEATLLLATLIGLIGVGTHLSTALRGLDVFLFLVAGFVSASAVALTGPEHLPPARPWFISHALAFDLSGTFFVAGGVAGAAYLLVRRMLRRKQASTLIGNVAPLESLERFGRWMPILGFPLLTYGILTGFCGVAHREEFRESAWYLDPSFLIAVAAWVVYAWLVYGVLHRPHVRGRQAATLSLCGMGLILMVFVARELLSPLHR